MNWKTILSFFVIASVSQAVSADNSMEKSTAQPNSIPVVTAAQAPSALLGPDERKEEPSTSPVDFFSGWPTRGKELFSAECARCHTIGHGAKVGPDLKNITAKGPREYLFNFIKNPDKYIQENHPIVVELLKHYGVKMPDLGLSRQETLDIFAYLKAAPNS